jgi:hypothetical protein
VDVYADIHEAWEDYEVSKVAETIGSGDCLSEWY